jgi:hypothetical protein
MNKVAVQVLHKCHHAATMEKLNKTEKQNICFRALERFKTIHIPTIQ